MRLFGYWQKIKKDINDIKIATADTKIYLKNKVYLSLKGHTQNSFGVHSF